MSPLVILAIVWGVVTAVLVVLLIYRSTLTMHEADQLFLDDAESHMQKEQTELLERMHKLQPMVRLFGAASGLLILVMAGWFVWDVFNRM
jgi:hypothetical protein